MQFKQGTGVYTSDGKEAGRLERVVINPKTSEITHIVLQTGSAILPDDKVVPVEMIATAEEERVNLRVRQDELKELPPFQESHYIVTNAEELARRGEYTSTRVAPVLYWYPPYPGLYGTTPYVPPPYPIETRTNIPAETVAVKEGAKIFARDGQELGEVERVLMHAPSEQATHFVISKGLFQKQRKLVPVAWVDQWQEDEVRLAVGTRQIEDLPDYKDAVR